MKASITVPYQAFTFQEDCVRHVGVLYIGIWQFFTEFAVYFSPFSVFIVA